MIKLFLVEDNELTLNYIEMNIPWENYGIQVVGKAVNGKIALQGISETNPDIVLSDIRMPLMDGLELITRLKEMKPEIKTVLLTAYDDFSYAQNAIKHGAVDYILKPVDDIELINTISLVRDQILQKQLIENEYQSLQERIELSTPLLIHDFLTRLVLGHYHDLDQINSSASFLNLAFPFNANCVISFCLDEYDNRLKLLSQKDKETLKFTLQQTMEEGLSHFEHHYIFSLNNQVISIINLPMKLQNTFIKKQLGSIIENCSTIQSHFKHHVKNSISIGISNISEGLDMISVGYKESQIALNHKFFIGNNSIICYNDIGITSNPLLYPKAIERKIIIYTSTGNIEGLSKTLDLFYEFALEHRSLPIQYVKEIIINFILQSLQEIYELEILDGEILQFKPDDYIKVFKMDTLESLCFYLRSQLLSICSYVLEIRNTRSKQLIDKAKGYIKLHYMEDISVDAVAKHVELNANYFSHIFKKLTNKSFSSFLVEFRLEQAKKLFANPHLKTVDISELIGYRDSKYFSQIFKKHTGHTPSDYRRKLLANELP